MMNRVLVVEHEEPHHLPIMGRFKSQHIECSHMGQIRSDGDFDPLYDAVVTRNSKRKRRRRQLVGGRR